MQHISKLAVDRLTKPWEEYVGYVYDDFVPKVRGPDGKKRYPEWAAGRPVRGTLTIGYGHTDAAGEPKIRPGLRMSETEAARVLAADMVPCERDVARLITVPLGQHQLDTLVDFVFNAGPGTLQKSTLRRRLNGGDYGCVPSELMKFTLSKGVHMDGLTHRRQAEIKMWNTPDDKPAAAKVAPADQGVDEDDVMVPKADLPASRPAIDSKSIAAGGTAIATGGSIVASVQKANEAAAPIREATENLQSLGVWDQLVGFASHHAVELMCVGLIALVGFMVWDRWRHLR